MPKLVVPEVATTAKNVSGPSASRTLRRAGPDSRWSASPSTPMNSASMTSQADAMEECALACAATLVGRGLREPVSAWRTRATARAVDEGRQVADVPPGTKTPPADGGRPARSATQRSAAFSAYTAPAPSSQEPP